MVKNLTEGKPLNLLFFFALPMVAGNLFQQLYNMVDTWVVGNFVSNEAFSAVGTVTPIINTLIGFFLGMSSGAGVVISQYYGAHRPEKVREAVHTAMLLTVIMGVVFTGVGIAMTPLMLELMKTPAEVAPDQTAYLTIYFAGIMGLLLYNMGSGILRAVGDSQRPFYFLLVSAGVNTALDLLFVLKFGMGVEGVAYATIIAQAVSAVLTIAVLIGYDGSVKLSLRDLRIHWDMLKKIVAVGIPAALQMAITAFSNVFVQGYINHFGADCMSGWTAYTKIDQLVILPVQSLSLASTTFVGQNYGAGRLDRVKRSVWVTLAIGVLYTLCTGAALLAGQDAILHLFTADEAVVTYGKLAMRWFCPFYFLLSILHGLAGAVRGTGASIPPMVVLLVSLCLFRVVWIQFLLPFFSGIEGVFILYPVSWGLGAVLMILYAWKGKWMEYHT